MYVRASEFMCMCFTLHVHGGVFAIVLLLPAVDDLVHVVLSGKPTACLLRSAPLLTLLPLFPL